MNSIIYITQLRIKQDKCTFLTFKTENRECSGRVLDSRRKGRGFKLHQRRCVVVHEQDSFILA